MPNLRPLANSRPASLQHAPLLHTRLLYALAPLLVAFIACAGPRASQGTDSTATGTARTTGTTAATAAATTAATAAPRPNVLFLLVDDLRPEFGAYGVAQARTPHLDALAASASVFERAVCNVPVCGASRASMMTGLRPDVSRFLDYTARIDEDAPGATTLFGHFKSAGYHTLGMGKVLHFADDHAGDWSEPFWDARPEPGSPDRHYLLPASVALASTSPNGRGPAFEAADVADDDYADGRLATHAVEWLREFSQVTAQPFFMAVGLRKPHLPFNAPQRYWDLYDAGDFRLPANYTFPESTPRNLYHGSGELHLYAGVPKELVLDTAFAKQLLHGYYAAMSYADAQVGRILAELERSGLADNTIVVLVGDHGYNLGDHTMWNKHCLFRSSLRVPLLVRAPGMPAGQRVTSVAEFVDLFPTLCELAGVEAPAALQGESLVPLLRDPGAPWRQEALTRWFDGDNVTTDRYSYSEWADAEGHVTARALFDFIADPLEQRNLAEDPAQATRVAGFAERLREVRAAMPAGEHPELVKMRRRGK